jgi:RNA polymerase sigma-70 factor, ECF subfamily
MIVRDSAEDQLKELAIRAINGDRRAYGRIFRECHEDIYDYIIRKVGNRSDAEDLTMQVFARGLKAIGTYEERGLSIRPWLYKIAHNAVVDYLRTRKHPVDIEEVVAELVDETDIAEEMLAREDLENIYREIYNLPDAQSEVLILRFLKDLSISETAIVLDKKEVTVRALQFKGIKNVRRKLNGQPESNSKLIAVG